MTEDTELQEFIVSPDGQYNKSIFLASYSDLTIFVEDTDRGNIYEVLLSRLLEEKISFEKIHLSGGKRKVMEFYHEHKKNPSVPRFFLVDLDFDDIHEHDKINDINFTYLNMYSIENYFIDKQVAGNFLNSRLQIGFDECLKKLNIDNWLTNLQDEYKNILQLYLVIQALGISMDNTKLTGEYFMENSSWKLDEIKISNYFEAVKKAAIESGKEKEFYFNYDYFGEKLELYSPNYWHMIPGKQLLACFRRYIVNFCEYKSVHLDDFYHLCSSHLDINKLQFLKNDIINYLSSYKSCVS